MRRVCAYGQSAADLDRVVIQEFKLMVQLGQPFTHRLICCSRYLLELTLRDFQVGSQEASVIYNSCDLEAFTSTPASAADSSAPPFGDDGSPGGA